VRDRDEVVFTEVRKNRDIPIVMLTSGGYQVTCQTNEELNKGIVPDSKSNCC